MNPFTDVDRYIDQHLDDSLAELSQLVAQPSIAAQGVGMNECAEMVQEMLERRGFEAELLPSGGGPPVVVAESAGRGHKTLLVYNHYDVKPAEPFELWPRPPFAPAL